MQTLVSHLRDRHLGSVSSHFLIFGNENSSGTTPRGWYILYGPQLMCCRGMTLSSFSLLTEQTGRKFKAVDQLPIALMRHKRDQIFMDIGTAQTSTERGHRAMEELGVLREDGIGEGTCESTSAEKVIGFFFCSHSLLL